MKTLINLPHEVHESTCYVNGLFDILKWKGGNYSYFLLPVVGGMASFAYLKFKLAQPPCMVYWGNSPKYLLAQLGEIIGFTEIISEGKAFKNVFPKIRSILNTGLPVMVGALDMYYLHYYSDLYKREHIPLHYLLLAGYDDDREIVFVHDCTYEGIKEIPYQEFESSLNINVPGLSKKNTYRIFKLPHNLPPELEVAEKGFAYKANRMLKPPVSLFGIPAMHKLATDIPTWTDDNCFKHMAAYAGLTPPLISEDLSYNDGLRFQQASLLKEMGQKYDRKSWIQASDLFNKSGNLIIRLSKEALQSNGNACSKTIQEIANIEEKAYKTLQ